MDSSSQEVVLRPATPEDIPGILSLLEEFVRQQVVLARTPEEMRGNYRNFLIAEDGRGTMIGVGALRPHSAGLYEIRSLAVCSTWQGKSVGRRLIEGLLEKSRKPSPEGDVCVFTLTKTPEFFRRLGFQEEPKEHFPEKIWADCRQCPKLHRCDETALRYAPQEGPASSRRPPTAPGLPVR